MEAQAMPAPGGGLPPPSVQEPLPVGEEGWVELARHKGEGMQTAASVSTMSVAMPMQPVASYVRPEGMPSAFASTPGARAFVPVRETAEGLSGALVVRQALRREHFVLQYHLLEPPITRCTTAFQGRRCTTWWASAQPLCTS